MKKLLIAFLLISSICSAAVTGPFPMAPGVVPPAAVAKVSEVWGTIFPSGNLSVVVTRFASTGAYAAGVSMDQVTAGTMNYQDFLAYIVVPLAAETITSVDQGVENWLIREGGPLQGWTKIP